MVVLVKFTFSCKYSSRFQLSIIAFLCFFVEIPYIAFFDAIHANSYLELLFFFLRYGNTVVFLALLFGKPARKIILFYYIIYAISISILTQTFLFSINVQFNNSGLASATVLNYVDSTFSSVLLVLLLLLRRRSNTFINAIQNFSLLPVRTFMLIIATLLCVAILENSILFQLTNPTISTDVTKVSSVILTVLLFLLIIYFMLINNSKIVVERTTTILSEQIKAQLAHYEAMKDYETELRKFRHDYGNMMLCLKVLLQADNVQQALDFIDDMETTFKSDRKSFDSGNYIADALLCEKDRIACHYNIVLDFDGFIPSYRISNLDLCIILTNAIDNAIEACAKISGEKIIEIVSEIRNGIWFLTIKNPVLRKVPIQNNIIMTTKSDVSMHGFGLQNINRTVKKRGGQLKLTCTDNAFTLDITMKLAVSDTDKVEV